MDNQQENKYDVLFENIPNDIKLSKRLEGKELEFIRDIHLTYDELYKKYNLTREQAKKIKHKVYNVYEANIPNGFKQIPYSKTHAVNENGDVINIRRRDYIKHSLNHKGYPMVCLENKRSRAVHRLVAEMFIPNPDNKPQVNHINGIKTDNNVNNLEWNTNAENIKHAFDNDLIDRNLIKINAMGSNNNMSKLSESDVLTIRELAKDKSDKEIAKCYGISRSTITLIRNRKIWTHI